MAVKDLNLPNWLTNRFRKRRQERAQVDSEAKTIMCRVSTLLEFHPQDGLGPVANKQVPLPDKRFRFQHLCKFSEDSFSGKLSLSLHSSPPYQIHWPAVLAFNPRVLYFLEFVVPTGAKFGFYRTDDLASLFYDNVQEPSAERRLDEHLLRDIKALLFQELSDQVPERITCNPVCLDTFIRVMRPCADAPFGTPDEVRMVVGHPQVVQLHPLVAGAHGLDAGGSAVVPHQRVARPEHLRGGPALALHVERMLGRSPDFASANLDVQ